MAVLSQLAFSIILWGSLLGVASVFLYELAIIVRPPVIIRLTR